MSRTTKPNPSKVSVPTTTTWLKVAVVETEDGIQHLIDQLGEYLPTNPVSLYLNCEGIDIGQGGSTGLGSIERLVLFVAPQSTVYVINLAKLGPFTAFSTPGTSGGGQQTTTLRSILESAHVPKAMFDVRRACAALSCLKMDNSSCSAAMSIAPQNVHDVQLMELATRALSKPKRYLASWNECVLTDGDGSVKSASELPARQPVPLLFDPRLFQLPVLWANYHAKLATKSEAFWVYMVRKAIKERVQKSIASMRNSNNNTVGEDDDRLGPWTPYEIHQESESWNENVLDEAMHGDGFVSDEWNAL
ncbi:hypothetical protein DV735_g5531, partial [Chaetothyriales sp. CBS 134920]